MQDLQKLLRDECYGRDLQQRRTWYSPAAEAYNRVRPRYPQGIIDQVVELAQLSSHSRILEIGCGPGVATPAFARLGCPMLCLEPNPDFVELARQNCQPYANVEIQNLAFEDWPVTPQAFDAVLAASSIHWIPPEIAFAKAATALQPEGHLILLWNEELQPSYELYQQLSQVYATETPGFNRAYRDSTTQVANLEQLGQMAIDSGYFRDLVSGWQLVEVAYTIEDYLLLLNTYSPHLKLESDARQRLFDGLQQVLSRQGETVELFYVSVFQVLRPVKQAK